MVNFCEHQLRFTKVKNGPSKCYYMGKLSSSITPLLQVLKLLIDVTAEKKEKAYRLRRMNKEDNTGDYITH